MSKPKKPKAQPWRSWPKGLQGRRKGERLLVQPERPKPMSPEMSASELVYAVRGRLRRRRPL